MSQQRQEIPKNQQTHTKSNSRPLEWSFNNREQALKNAAKAKEQIQGKKMVRVDGKTWKYV